MKSNEPKHEAVHHVGSVWWVVEVGSRRYISTHYSQKDAESAAAKHNASLQFAEMRATRSAGFVRKLPEPGTCQCGMRADWNSPVFGTTGEIGSAVWAGCPNQNCRGTAVGGPINLLSYERLIAKADA